MPALTVAFDKTGISDRAVALFASAVLEDIGMLLEQINLIFWTKLKLEESVSESAKYW